MTALEIYKDWGAGQPVVFSHGWPLAADLVEGQMLFLAQRGYRGIAHAQRGHGRSRQPWNGNDMNTYADDLAALPKALDLRDTVHVSHSTGGGDVFHYPGRHGRGRVARAAIFRDSGARPRHQDRRRTLSTGPSYAFPAPQHHVEPR